MVILLVLAAAAAQPTPDALRLGRELADHGTLAALLPLQKQKEVAELISENKELTSDEQAKLRLAADKVYVAMSNRILDATGRAYAEQLSMADLRTLVQFYRSPVAARFQSALPKAIIVTMESVGGVDFKGDVRAAFCKDTGKLCIK